MPDEAHTIRAALANDAAAMAKLWSVMAEQHRAYDAEVWCWAQDAIERWAEKYVGFTADEDMILHVALANTPATRLYGKLGFRRVAYRMYRRL